nr:hypothetical transcript [Hymenolepis microstoma]
MDGEIRDLTPEDLSKTLFQMDILRFTTSCLSHTDTNWRKPYRNNRREHLFISIRVDLTASHITPSDA